MNYLSSLPDKAKDFFGNWSKKRLLCFLLLMGAAIAPQVLASGGGESQSAGHGSEAAVTFLWIAVILIFLVTSGKFILPQILQILKITLPFLTKFIGI